MTDKPYSTDLKDKEWELIKPLLERKQGRQGNSYTLCAGSSMAASMFCAAVFRGA
jgi:transposase